MARARNIKPKFFENEDLAELDPLARLLFIGLWTIADFKGCLEYRPKRIKVQLLAYDECNIAELANILDKSGFISIYSVQGQQYIKIINFEKHQNPHKNEREGGSNIPDIKEKDNPIKDLENIQINRDKNGTARADSLFPLPDSLNLNPDSLIPETRILKPKKTNVGQTQPDADVINQIFDFWKKMMNSPKSVLDDKRVKLIVKALKNYPADQVCIAIRGCARSPYHMGDNDTKTLYNQLSLILRSAEYIDKFIKCDTTEPRLNKQESLEARNREVAKRLAAGGRKDD